MRTVDQVVQDLKKAREQVATAKKAEDALVAELQVIYHTVSNALGIGSIDPQGFK